MGLQAAGKRHNVLMANHRNRFPARRRFLKQSTALTASVVALPALATERDAETGPAPDTSRPPARPAGGGRLGLRRRREGEQQ